MIKIIKKIKFSKNDNKMKDFGNVSEALKYFRERKNKNKRGSKNRYRKRTNSEC